ncbi:XRE family transcriptional regulator [Lactococcus garvieae]|uniref:Phage repressor protein C, contains Cro/C1-type HTH and peptisase s24 domains n=1 Tax=Lactococcus garvieae TaxID=1363 RepID=A0A1I4J4S0_9LACT|nr:XRE family transcriptional regulator [Lactococcus garvieae]SFL61549.1 Phage repressor protein C, contains Cro/C1-type HTH and peptisase s24 domains [Lactococcus garvieae]
MIEFPERLKELRKEKGFTQKELAELVGFSYQNLQKYEKGIAKPLNKNLIKISDIFDVSVSYLLGETDVRKASSIYEIYEQLTEPRKKRVYDFTSSQLKEQIEENNIISLHHLVPYEVEEEQALSAGNGEGYTSSQNKGTVYWDQDIAYDKAVWIKGDSMEPDFHYGDVALIKYQNYLDFPGQICAVDDVERGQAYIKSVRIEDKYLVLHSLNDSIDGDGNLIFPDKYIPLSENPRIIGKVVDHFTPIEK